MVPLIQIYNLDSIYVTVISKKYAGKSDIMCCSETLTLNHQAISKINHIHIGDYHDKYSMCGYFNGTCRRIRHSSLQLHLVSKSYMHVKKEVSYCHKYHFIIYIAQILHS